MQIKPLQEYTFKNRHDILDYFPKDSVIAELGVFKGKFAYYIVRHPNIKEYIGIDVWWSLYGPFFPWKSASTHNGRLTTLDAYHQSLDRIKGYKATLQIGETTEILRKMKDNSLDAVYIDSSHEYEQTTKELKICRKKVRPGGVIAGHDYGSTRHPGVTQAVNEFVEAQGASIRFEFIDNCNQWLLYNRR